MDEQAYDFDSKPGFIAVKNRFMGGLRDCKYGVKIAMALLLFRSTCVLYPTNQPEQSVNAEDGFKLTFNGLIQRPVRQKLDMQTESFDVSITYVNEFVKKIPMFVPIRRRWNA